jgi:hypothetical protein
MAADISFTLSEQDCVDAARAQYRRRITTPRQWRLAIAILLTTFAMFAYLDSCDLQSALYSGAVYAGLLVLVCPLFALLGYLLAGNYARRMFRQQAIHPGSQIAWSDEGFQNQNELGSLAAKWRDFYGWRKDRGSFTLFMNEGIYYFIPQRALSSEEAMDLEETLLRSGLAQR